MIALSAFLQGVQDNAERIHAYELGHDGSDGKSDCIGLIIRALALEGCKWPGVHGSNWAARNAMATLEHIADAGEMFLGEIVYKAREPGDPNYRLPDRYKSSGDLRDYYHVGVVTQISPLVITHCTSVEGGIARDTKIGNWRWGGRLKYVDYNEEEPDMETPYNAIVTADSGRTVNLRAKPDIKSTIIARVDVGETVAVLDELGEWSKVAYAGKQGYMMNMYLWPENSADEPDEEDGDTVAVSREDMDNWAFILESLASEMREKLGRG